jgi:hypothetical protein
VSPKLVLAPLSASVGAPFRLVEYSVAPVASPKLLLAPLSAWWNILLFWRLQNLVPFAAVGRCSGKSREVQRAVISYFSLRNNSKAISSFQHKMKLNYEVVFDPLGHQRNGDWTRGALGYSIQFTNENGEIVPSPAECPPSLLEPTRIKIHGKCIVNYKKVEVMSAKCYGDPFCIILDAETHDTVLRRYLHAMKDHEKAVEMANRVMTIGFLFDDMKEAAKSVGSLEKIGGMYDSDCDSLDAEPTPEPPVMTPHEMFTLLAVSSQAPVSMPVGSTASTLPPPFNPLAHQYINPHATGGSCGSP